MKKISLVASLLLLLASCAEQGSNTTTPTTPVTSVESVILQSASIAYVDMELVLTESDMYQREGILLQQRTEATQREWAQKEQKFAEEAQQLQQKYQNGLITTANAQREQQSIESRVQAFQEATQRQARELDEENNVFANRAQRIFSQAVTNVNTDKRYSMIISASALIDADTTLNITRLVLNEVNALYKAE